MTDDVRGELLLKLTNNEYISVSKMLSELIGCENQDYT